jgi:hypothetical protein
MCNFSWQGSYRDSIRMQQLQVCFDLAPHTWKKQCGTECVSSSPPFRTLHPSTRTHAYWKDTAHWLGLGREHMLKRPPDGGVFLPTPMKEQGTAYDS